MSGKIDLTELFQSLQSEMESCLGLGRSAFSHPVMKGDVAEESWRDLLTKYLPERYAVNKAVVIDSDGNTSDQIDVVIHDRQYSPFILKHAGGIYVPAESVYCVFEVKQALNKENLEYAGSKLSSVRRLKRTTAPIKHLNGTSTKDDFQIMGGLLALDYESSRPIIEYVSSIMSNMPSIEKLDIGCSIKGGGFFFIERAGIESQKSQDNLTSLVSFLFHLQDALRSLGTVPAIDFNAYAKSF